MFKTRISHENDVSLLGVGGNGAGDGGEAVRVEDGLLRPEERGQLLLEVNVDVYEKRLKLSQSFLIENI